MFYDALLVHVAPGDRLDWVSGKGFAVGYFGGGFHFALSLGIIAGHETLGISQSLAARLALGTAGLWWLSFAVFTLVLVREPGAVHTRRGPAKGLKKFISYAAHGVKSTLETTRQAPRHKNAFLFLLAFLCYNDGVQTVIYMATIYGKQELGLSTTTLMLTLLAIQAVAVFGALFFGFLGQVLSAKRALQIVLTVWCAVVIYGYFLTGAAEFFVMGLFVGLVLGGVQSLSRSLFAAVIPAGESGQYFGFFSVFNKLSAVFGPLVFAVVTHVTGGARPAVLSMIAFFVAGFVMLLFVKPSGPAERGPKPGLP